MPLRRTEKQEIVNALATELKQVASVAVVSFRMLTMKESAALRQSLRGVHGSLQVVPKRLFARVVAALGWPAALAETGDSVAVAWTGGPAKLQRSGGPDLVAPAKNLHAYAKSTEGARLLGGMLHGEPLDGPAVERLALLPSPEILRGQLVSVLAGPLRGVLGVFTSVLRGVPVVLKAKAQL